MADVPWPLWPGHPRSLASAKGLGDAAWRVLTALWKLVDAGATATGPSALWESRAAGRRPCVWPSVAWLRRVCELCERSVNIAIAELERRGWVESGYAVVGEMLTRARVRWLADPEADEVPHEDAGATAPDAPHEDAPTPAQPCGAVDELEPAPFSRAGPARARRPARAGASLRLLPAQQCGVGEEGERSEEGAAAAAGVAPHDDAGAQPCGGGRSAVRGAQVTGRAPAGAAGSNRRRVGSPAAPTRTAGKTADSGEQAQSGGAARAAGHPDSPERRALFGQLPARPPATTSGTSAGRRWDAVELIAELGRLDAGPGAQRIAADRTTRDLADQLLAVPLDGLTEDDAREARRSRFEAVLATAEAFAKVCLVDPEKRRWWRGAMLSLRARARPDGGEPTSPWQRVESDAAEAELVEAELERGREAARAMVAAQAAEAERVAAGRVTPELAAAGASELFRRLRDRETAGSTG